MNIDVCIIMNYTLLAFRKTVIKFDLYREHSLLWIKFSLMEGNLLQNLISKQVYWESKKVKTWKARYVGNMHCLLLRLSLLWTLFTVLFFSFCSHEIWEQNVLVTLLSTWISFWQMTKMYTAHTACKSLKIHNRQSKTRPELIKIHSLFISVN